MFIFRIFKLLIELPLFFLSGPPGPPGGIRVEEVRDTAVALTWSRGTDNHSPISKYTIQSKTFLSEEWKDAKTGKSNARSSKANRFLSV